MSGIELTEEQAAVVTASHAAFTVRAAAGAGKTRVLVQRYLRHVKEDGIRPDRILAITFTRKAAAEMKERIVGLLREEGRLWDAQVAETGPIQTIHGFCERVLRENALSAGIDPTFTILAEDDAKRLLRRAFEQAVESVKDEPFVAGALRLCAGKAGESSKKLLRGRTRTVHAFLEESVEQILKSLRGADVSLEQLEATHADPTSLSVAWESAVLAAAPMAVQEAAAIAEGGSFLERLAAAYRGVERKVPGWIKNLDTGECARQSCGIMRVALETWRRLEAAMEREQGFDFIELEARAVRLVTESAATRQRLQGHYAVVLVDEAQDLNPVQYRLIASLGLSTEMLVGDAQQSIYGFRLADVELFLARSEQTPCLRLSLNFRSEPGILRFVDRVFAHAWNGRYHPMTQAEFAFEEQAPQYDGVELWETPTFDPPQTALWIHELIAEGESPGDIAVLVTGGSAAERISEALDRREVPNRIMGGTAQFYTRMVVRDVANALQALADPTDDAALLALLRSPIVGASLDAVVLLGGKRPVIEALAEFQSPVPGDQEAIARLMGWYAPLSLLADRLSAWEALGEVLRSSPFLERLAARRKGQELANVRKLFAMAAAQPHIGLAEFARRIREVQVLGHREGDAPAIDEARDAVSIMTVHKAKGLEFPVVVLPDTFQSPSWRQNHIRLDARLGLTAIALDQDSTNCPYARWLDERRKQRESEESLRKLYVAMTRAKRRLCVCASASAKQATAAQVVSRAVWPRSDLPPGVRIRRRSDATI